MLQPIAVRAQLCSFISPIGGSGNTTVVKRVGAPKLSPIGIALGRTNWNTDFAVNQAFSNYKLFFTAQSTEKARYPVQAFLKFSDGTNLQVVNELITPPMVLGPYRSDAAPLSTSMLFMR